MTETHTAPLVNGGEHTHDTDARTQATASNDNTTSTTNRSANNAIGGYIQMVRFFDGKEDSISFADFIQSLELAAEFGGWNSHQKLGVFKARLAEPALTFLNGTRDLKTINYDTLKELFADWYRPQTPLVDPLATFYQSRQRPGELAKSFVERLRAMAVSVAPSSMPAEERKTRLALVDKSIVSIFVKGLNRTSGASQVAMLKPTHLTEALSLAVMYEQSSKNHANRIAMVSDAEINDFDDQSEPAPCPIRTRNPPSMPASEPHTTVGSTQSIAANKVCVVNSHRESQIEGIRASITELAAQVSSIRDSVSKQSRQAPREQSRNPTRFQQNQNNNNYRSNDLAGVSCYLCRERGHYANRCPRLTPAICNFCRKTGHAFSECRARLREANSARGARMGGGNHFPQPRPRPQQRFSVAEPNNNSRPQDFQRSSAGGHRRAEQN